jgi:pyruvate ferredoxin oxidoreductase alpha subunit
VEELKEEGIGAKLLKIRTFRPFPQEKIKESLRKATVVAVMDRSVSFGAVGGPIFLEVRSALFEEEKRIPVVNYIYGLGGRNIGIEHIKKVYQDLIQIKKTGKVKNLVSYLGVRE